MIPLIVLSALSDFLSLITGYFIEIWDFLIFIGAVGGVMVVLAGGILWLTSANTSWGRSLVFSGIVLCIVVEYFVLFPPEFIIS
ncbi:MAG: conserved membrane protein of unknown function [Candidatus Thorarchaeota archaeon]|nr:MAG: conserved membrane protein of unknown function [Candidatus Thorarchaeota archaeon]